VRSIAIQALKIHTGHRNGFARHGSAEARAKAIATWTKWLAEYEKTL
jgi:hypothetical protein